MEDKGAKLSKNKKQNEDTDPASKIVSDVINEYDVIETSEDNSSSQNTDSSLRSSETPTSHTGNVKSSSIPVQPQGDAVDRGSDENVSSTESINNRNRLASSDRSNTITDDQVYLINYPRTNCAERIIFCLDSSLEMEKLTFRSRAGDKYSSKRLAKKCINMFLQSKQKIDRKHEYALVLLKDSAVWARDFTNNPKDIQVALEDIVDTNAYETCDAASVFDQILGKVDIPRIPVDPTCFPPPYIVRIIFIYGRSNCPLEFSKRESFNTLNMSPYVFIDALYLHEPPGEDNQCQEVFNSICDLDQKGLAYILGASRNPTKAYDSMAQLLAHPLQRPQQNDAAYRIGSSIPENNG